MDSVVALDTGATANLVCFSWLAHHNSILEKHEFPKVTANPSEARFGFGDGRFREVCRAAEIPAWVAGNKGKFTASVLGGGVPALLRQGAMEALGGRLDFLRGSLLVRRQGVRAPLKGEYCGTLYPERCRFSEGPVEECVEMSGGQGLVFCFGS